MIKVKQKYGRSLRPKFEEDFSKIERAIEFFQAKLKIDTDVLITFKEKKDLWESRVGVCFYNEHTQGITIHCHVHRNTGTIPCLILVAHEMVHAWQIDGDLPDIAQWEDVAEEKSLELCKAFLDDEGDDTSQHTLRLTRFFIH